jgi:DinB superfamily
MKTLRFTLSAALLIACAAAQTAPNVVGDWTGTLDANGTLLHVVVHLKGDAKQLTGAVDSLDQGAMGIPIETGKVDGSTLHFNVDTIAGSYEGTVNDSATEVVGNWEQGGAKLPLTLKRAAAKAAEPAVATSKPLSPADRDFLISYLEKTRAAFLASIAGVTPAQWTFKADPTRWSIGECAEHIIASEKLIFALSVGILKNPVDATHTPATRAQDEGLIAAVTDRSHKAQAPEPLKPHGTLPSPAEAATQFNAARDHTIEYVRTTQEDLRGHTGATPLSKTTEAYAGLLLLAAHSSRHTAQILEVKAADGYPK